MNHDYGFQDKLLWASGVAARPDVAAILREHLPNIISVDKAQVSDDRNGTDYWGLRAKLPPLSIDVKVRDVDPIQTFGKDDLALEIWSNVEAQRRGWTLDPMKRTDYVMWYFVPTMRWLLIPFPMLQTVFRKYIVDWQHNYQCPIQSSDNGRWHSQCVFVPRLIVWRAIYQEFGGNPKGNGSNPQE